jgi:hypothetical protein
MWQGYVNGVIGLWLMVAAFMVTGSKTGNLVNDLITGVVLLVLGIWAAVGHKSWQNWVVAIIGAWMIVAGLSFPSAVGGNVGNDLIGGAAVAAGGFWSAVSKEAHRAQAA